MDIELYAWRRFARAWPLVAGLLLLLVPGVREWLAAEVLEAGLAKGQSVTDAVLTPMLERIAALATPAPQ